MINKTGPCNSLNLRNALLRVRVDTQKNQTEDGEKSLHGVESTPVWSGVQTPSETSSCHTGSNLNLETSVLNSLFNLSSRIFFFFRMEWSNYNEFQRSSIKSGTHLSSHQTIAFCPYFVPRVFASSSDIPVTKKLGSPSHLPVGSEPNPSAT